MDNQTIRVSPILAPIVSRSIRENKMGEGKRHGRDGRKDKLRKKWFWGGADWRELNINSRVISCSWELWPEPSGTWQVTAPGCSPPIRAADTRPLLLSRFESCSLIGGNSPVCRGADGSYSDGPQLAVRQREGRWCHVVLTKKVNCIWWMELICLWEAQNKLTVLERRWGVSRMDVLPSGGIFRELQAVHDTGYFSGQASLEEDWQQVFCFFAFFFNFLHFCKFAHRCLNGLQLG